MTDEEKRVVIDELEKVKQKIDETYKHFEDKHLRYGLSISKVLIDDSIDELKGSQNK